jgi:uncharacterized protein (DUF1684 family)
MRSKSFDGLMRAVAIVALTAAMTLRVAAAENSQDEYTRIADWHAKRLASLTSETGWLTPIALYWLKDGENSFGRAADRAFSLDDAALAADTGAFVLTNGRVRYVAHASRAMTYLGKPVASLDLVSDADAKPTELVAGSLHFMLIQRDIHAHFEPYVPEHRIPIVNILGMTEDMTSPGAIVFERGGRSWRLDAILEAPGDRKLFVMFSDATSGKQTYGAGRFLYVDLPKADHIEVDFNEAFNPPCAFTDFATCPLPPQQNRLALAIDAGELKYERLH